MAGRFRYKNCQEQLAKGVCVIEDCPFNHSFLICEPCGITCPSRYSFNQHLNGRNHRRQSSGAIHPPGTDTVYCSLCDQQIIRSSWSEHIRGKWHNRQQRFAPIQQALEDSEKDKHGIAVESTSFDLGLVDVSELNREKIIHATVRNSVSGSDITLVQCRITSKINGRFETGFSVDAVLSGTKVTPTCPLDVTVRFYPRYPGSYEDRLEFHFEDSYLNERFAITRKLFVTVVDRADYDTLRPTAPYMRKQYRPRQTEGGVVPGERPEQFAEIQWVVPLPKADIPASLSRILASGNEENAVENLKKAFIPREFTPETYARRFRVLLHIEEYRSEQDLQQYDMEDVEIQSSQRGKMKFLRVPGLAEKRPSVILGDRILVKPNGESKWYEGFVHDVNQTEVGLVFSRGFEPISRQKHLVRFKLNRLVLRRMHQAMDTAFHPDRLLFPTPDHAIARSLRAPTPAEMAELTLVNRKIGDNPPQLRAVSAIVRMPPGSPPFIIFGPPGTGKTVTVIEAVHQLLRTKRLAKILICAPSNSAADLIAERLAILQKGDLFRLNAPSRLASQLPPALDKFSRKNGRGIFGVPPLEELKKFRVIVSTCASAAAPYNIGFPRGHFSHIFVDEAGQANEPEAMIGIKTLSDNSTNVILSGDPKQLGPVTRSAIARQLGLSQSYQDRLMERELYQSIWSGKTVVKLLKNWRSHNAILRFPNEHFYGGELQQCADPVIIDSYLQSDILPRKGFPVIFHSMKGKDEREASSPSFFNIVEASAVKKYIQDLMLDRRVRITHDDIGVISPYHAQCQKIRRLLLPTAPRVKVGSVEEFQGQERRVIIISTVRSSLDFLAFDLKHTLGFVANPRRFNVAITRAQALLIIIGDPDVLGQDPLWRRFLNYIYGGGGWKGPPMNWDPNEVVSEEGYDEAVKMHAEEDMRALMHRLRGLGLDDDGDETEGNFDRPWREED